MSFTRVYANKDTSIANADPSAGSKDISETNVGASEILNLYKTSEQDATSSILIAFPQLTPQSGTDVYLKLFAAQHELTLPYGYSVVVRPIEQSWAEGSGHDLDYYTDDGVANWLSATVSTAWVTATGSSSASFFFECGHENLEVEVTDFVTSTFGFKLDIADTGTDLYIKKFHSRHTHFPTRRPYLEYRIADATGTLSSETFYRVVSGSYSGTVWSSSSAWSDFLSSGTMISMTSYISDVDPTSSLVVSIPALKPVYDTSEVVRLGLQVQRKDWNTATAPTGSSVTPNVVLTKVYYRVVDVLTDDIVVPFSTSSIEYTRMSYDDSGSFFYMSMSNFQPDCVLQFDFLYEAPTGSGNWTLIPGTNNRFRVITHG
jgi:hypothetical protein